MRRTTLRVIACDCIRKGVCHRDGERGHLVVQVLGRQLPVRRCRYCK